MPRGLSRRQSGALAVVTALALPGGIAALLVTSGGSFTSELDATAVPAVSAPALAPPALAAQTAGSPASTPADPVRTAATTPPLPSPKVVAKPPPVVDGVRRADVGLAHSPQIQQQLSADAPDVAPASGAGAVGVDVADYQHRNGALIDWPEVATAGYQFAFVKATEGDYYVNPYYAYDLAQARAAGLYVAGYHFAIPNVSSGASQADYALGNGAYTPSGRTMPLALDIEYNPYGRECYGMTPGQMVSWVSSFTSEARRLTGQRPIIYTTADWWNTCTGDSTAFGADQLWVAAYGADRPPLPAGWSSWTFWQYTSRGRVPGITGPVDVSYFLSAARLAQLAPPTSAPASSPPSPPSRSPSAPPSSSPAPPRPAPPSPTSPPSPSTTPTPTPTPTGSTTPTPTPTPTPTEPTTTTSPTTPTATQSAATTPPSSLITTTPASPAAASASRSASLPASPSELVSAADWSSPAS